MKLLSRTLLRLHCLAAILMMATHVFAVEIQKVIPFTTADSLRVDVRLKPSGEVGPVRLTAEIIRDENGKILWRGPLGEADLRADEATTFQYTVRRLKPVLWSPATPHLYTLRVTATDSQARPATTSTRIGFRSFESRHGQFLLNGKPVFLRGVAINPPGRTIPPEVGESPAFAEAYLRFMKSQNVNIVRLEHDSQVWFDLCDEVGMMVFQGRYGAPLEAQSGKQSPPSDFNKSLDAYKELFESYAAHPSIVIYVLSNELPYSGERGKAFHEYLSRLHRELKQWNPRQLFIGNAGYGEGREGDICDVHRYWGWYYNTFVTYNNLRDQSLFGDPRKNQPITFTECVGNYTGPRGDYNLIVRRQLGAQMNWTGHSPNQIEDALTYQAFMTKQATETFRRLRPLNPRLAGIMPFTILFHHWQGIRSFDEMIPKPAMKQLAVSYQPVLPSWELWTPQVYAGATISPVVHVINDSESAATLSGARFSYRLTSSGGQEILRGETKLPKIGYYRSWSKKLSLDLPDDLTSGDYVLSGEIVVKGRVIATNQVPLFVAGEDWKARKGLPQRVLVFDPSGQTASVLGKLGLNVQPIENFRQLPFPATGHVVVGEKAWNLAAAETKGKLREFVDAGGRVICLQPEPSNFESNWLPEPVTFLKHSANETTYPPAGRPFRDNMHINPERPEHPVFAGIERKRLAFWSDYTGWNQMKPGFPKVYPVTTGFRLQKSESLATTAVLADYDRGLEGVALCEMFSGKGSVLLCGFDLVNRAGLDPVADRLLKNLMAYAAQPGGHHVYPLIDSPIRWGDYASERGLVHGSLNGFVVHAEWTPPPTHPSATPLQPEQGEWSLRPGDQFVPVGRRILGSYTYSTSTSLKDLMPNLPIANGYFWLRIPAGLKNMATTVQNPDKVDGELTVSINARWGEKPTIVPAGQTITIRTPLNGAKGDTSVRYMGTKTLVLTETAFE